MIFGLTIPEIWDYRIIIPLFVLSLTLYFLARIEWKDVKRAWIFIIVLVVFIVGLNGLLSGRGGPYICCPGKIADPISKVAFLYSRYRMGVQCAGHNE